MRTRQLKSCLEALAKQDYPQKGFEVIIVDDGGPDSLESLINDYTKRLDIMLIRISHAGPAAARNKGSEYARGLYLAFTDDDCAPAGNWLRNLAVHVNENPTFAFGGRVVNILKNNTYSMASELLITYLREYYNKTLEKARFVTSNNLCIPAESFKRIGGFDVVFERPGGEDRDLCARWLQRGYSIEYKSDTVVNHAHDLTLRDFLLQHFSYGRGGFVYHKKRLREYSESLQVEPLKFIKGLIRYSCSSDQRKCAMFILFIVSQLADIAGFFTEVVLKISRRSVLVNQR